MIVVPSYCLTANLSCQRTRRIIDLLLRRLLPELSIPTSMNRKDAISLLLAEAFAENGLAMLALQGNDPGYQRLETLISAVNLLSDELTNEDSLDRKLVSALFTLGTLMQEAPSCFPPLVNARPSLFQQIADLHVAVTELIENWSNWQSVEMPKSQCVEPTKLEETDEHEQLAGYRVNDVTYCVLEEPEDFFPVSISRLGFNVIEVQPYSVELCQTICEAFLKDRLNRCFSLPTLSPLARFGGSDPRPVNIWRTSGPLLRLLPCDYNTITTQRIKARHSEAPDQWPLPTGMVFDRWF